MSEGYLYVFSHALGEFLVSYLQKTAIWVDCWGHKHIFCSWCSTIYFWMYSYDTYVSYWTWQIYLYIVFIIFYEFFSVFLWKISFWVNSGHTQGILGPKSLVAYHKLEKATSNYQKWLSKTNSYVLYVYLVVVLDSCTWKTPFWGILGPGMSVLGS